jgi:hypothetical protein
MCIETWSLQFIVVDSEASNASHGSSDSLFKLFQKSCLIDIATGPMLFLIQHFTTQNTVRCFTCNALGVLRRIFKAY